MRKLLFALAATAALGAAAPASAQMIYFDSGHRDWRGGPGFGYHSWRGGPSVEFYAYQDRPRYRARRHLRHWDGAYGAYGYRSWGEPRQRGWWGG